MTSDCRFRQQRLEPKTAPPPDLMYQASMLCAALDGAEPLASAQSGVHRRLCLQGWLRERFELFVGGSLPPLLFPPTTALRVPPTTARDEPHPPTTALSLLSDLSHALDALAPYTRLNLRAILDGAIARELGGMRHVFEDDHEDEAPAVQEEGGPAVLARGTLFHRAVAGATAPNLTHLAPDLADVRPAPSKSLSRVLIWVQREVERAQAPGGPQFRPARRAFEGSCWLDAVQLSALARLLGCGGMEHVNRLVLQLCVQPIPHVHAVLTAHLKPLETLAQLAHLPRTHRAPCRAQGEPCRARGEPCLADVLSAVSGLESVMSACRRAGVALVTRTLIHEGVRTLKSEVLPPFVTTFVKGLGLQPLSDGTPAARRLQPVTKLLAGYGLLGGLDTDEPLASAVAGVCPDLREGLSQVEQGAVASAWTYLPQLLALTLSQPLLDLLSGMAPGVEPGVAVDALADNVLCAVYTFHLLLCLSEPHIPRRTDDPPNCTILAHLRFMETASLVLAAALRPAGHGHHAHETQPSDEAPTMAPMQRVHHAAAMLLLEQLEQVAQAVHNGELEAFVPHSLVLASYASVLPPATSTK